MKFLLRNYLLLSLITAFTLFLNLTSAIAEQESSAREIHQGIRFEKIPRFNSHDTYELAREILNSYTWEQWVERWSAKNKNSDKYKNQESLFSDFINSNGFEFIDPVWTAGIYASKDYDELRKCFYNEESGLDSKNYLSALIQPFFGPVALYDFRKLNFPENHPYKNLIAVVVYNEIVPQKSAEFSNGDQLEIGASGFLSHVLYLFDIERCEKKQRLPISSSHLGGYADNAIPNLIGVGVYGDKLATYNVRKTQSENLFFKLWVYDQDQKTDKNFGFDTFVPLRLHMPNYSIKNRR